MVIVYGPGLKNGVNPNETTYFTIDTSNAGNAALEVFIIDDFGECVTELTQRSDKVFECKYTPKSRCHKVIIIVFEYL